jgi:hypothetical protein
MKEQTNELISSYVLQTNRQDAVIRLSGIEQSGTIVEASRDDTQ